MIKTRLPIAVAFSTIALTSLVAPDWAHAAGMIPETSVVIVNESDGETSINVKNSDDHPALLYSNIQGIEGDNENLIVLTPPVTRVEAGETQLVRFILQSPKPLDVQRLRRVTFEGITPKDNSPGMRVSMNVRQNLPVIINPKGLAKDREPWLRLKWSVSGGKLVVDNPSAYVVRLAQSVNILPSNTSVQLPQTYILPRQKLELELPVDGARDASSVRLYPATVYGYAVDSHEAQLEKK
ncbi:fimbria/pilus chaperone family protein [Pseudomonas chlororaphis]|uniref:fimbria/pilus chaperone family protein n=1 Tax=Pseudomonas chlororaphis TaxID=587753 RepID=UPI0037CAA4CC